MEAAAELVSAEGCLQQVMTEVHAAQRERARLAVWQHAAHSAALWSLHCK